MNSEQTWQFLAASALIGTDRQAPEMGAGRSAAGGELKRIEEHLAARTPSERLLSLASALTLYRRSGSLPLAGSLQIPADSAPENIPIASPAVAPFLTVLLSGEPQELLREFLEALERESLLVSPPFLPSLLDAGRRHAEIRASILAVGGQRLRWLAAQNTQWEWANIGIASVSDEDSSTSVWESGPRAARLALLKILRRDDPARARALIESTWKQENASDRAAMIACLETGLSNDDESLLNAALADRSLEVGRTAFEMLTRLPASQISRRMAERAQSAVRFKRKFLIGWSLDIHAPEEFGEALKADRLEEKSPYSTLGVRAWLLAQIVGAAPLSIWNTPDKPQPTEQISLALKSEWADALILGWGMALKRHPDPAWFEALARDWMTRVHRTLLPLHRMPQSSGFPDVAEKLIVELLRSEKEPLHDLHPAFALLNSQDSNWSTDLSRIVMQNLERRVTAPESTTIHVFSLQASLVLFARRMPPQMAVDVTTLFPAALLAATPRWARSIETLIQTLQFRHDMLTTIHDSTPRST